MPRAPQSPAVRLDTTAWAACAAFGLAVAFAALASTARADPVVGLLGETTATIASELASRCNVQTMDAYDPSLPRPLLATAVLAFVDPTGPRVLGYVTDVSTTSLDVDYLTPNGATIAQVMLPLYWPQIQNVTWLTSSYLSLATPGYYPGMVAWTQTVYTVAGRGYQSFCRNAPVDAEGLSDCIRSEFVEPIVQFYCQS